MKNQHAVSLLKVKAVNEDTREITGIATTPSPDRYGDIVMPEGLSSSCLSRCYGSTTISPQ